MEGSVNLDISGEIGTIEFYHPKGNSLPGKLLTELSNTIADAASEEEVKIIILRSKGEGAFCAGASFDELASLTDKQQGTEFFMGFARVILAMKNCPKLIVARVHGKAVGGGVGLIAAADYSIASSAALIKLSELNLGIGPFVIAPAVERKIGVSALSTLSIDASNWQSAQWALQKGLYNKVVSTTEELDAHIAVLTEKLASSSLNAMKELKTVLWSGNDNLKEIMEKRARISGELALSDFTKDFIQNFMEN